VRQNNFKKEHFTASFDMGRFFMSQKILSVLPVSIAGALIIKAFSRGFEQNGASVLSLDVRELDEKRIRNFAPDMVFCYDWGYLDDDEAANFIRSLKIPLVHYFADEPKSKYADFNGQNLHLRLLGDEKIFCWDEKYLNDFSPPAQYFPLCADESLYGGQFEGYDYDVTFVGRPLGACRQELLAEIVKAFPDKLKIFSYPAHFERSVNEMAKMLEAQELEAYKKTFAGFIEDERALAKIYRSSKVNLNVNLQGENSLNYRTYEVLASGGTLLADRAGEFGEFIETFSSPTEAVQKIEYLLLNNSKISENGGNARCTRFLEKYNVKIQAAKLLKKCLL
jgi:hypothetical protein